MQIRHDKISIIAVFEFVWKEERKFKERLNRNWIKSVAQQAHGKTPGIKKFDDLSRFCWSEIVFEDKFIRDEHYMLEIEFDSRQM